MQDKSAAGGGGGLRVAASFNPHVNRTLRNRRFLHVNLLPAQGRLR